MNVTRTLYLLSKYIKMDDIHGSDQVAVEVLLIFLTFIIPLFFLVNLTKCKKQAIILFSGIWLCTAVGFMNTYIKHAQYIIKQAEQEKTAANVSGKDLKILQEGGQEAIRLLEDLRSSFREGSTEWNKITGNIEKLKTPGGKLTKGDISRYNEYLRNQRVIKTREVNKENLKREELGLQPVRVRQQMPTGASYTRSTGNETKDALRDIFAWNGKMYLGQKAKKLHAAGRLEAEGVNIIPEGDEFVLRVPEGTKTPDQIFLRDKQTGISYEARSGAFSKSTPSAGTAPTEKTNTPTDIKQDSFVNPPQEKVAPEQPAAEPQAPEPASEPVSVKELTPKPDELSGATTKKPTPPPPKFDPANFIARNPNRMTDLEARILQRFTGEGKPANPSTGLRELEAELKNGNLTPQFKNSLWKWYSKADKSALAPEQNTRLKELTDQWYEAATGSKPAEASNIDTATRPDTQPIQDAGATATKGTPEKANVELSPGTSPVSAQEPGVGKSADQLFQEKYKTEIEELKSLSDPEQIRAKAQDIYDRAYDEWLNGERWTNPANVGNIFNELTPVVLEKGVTYDFIAGRPHFKAPKPEPAFENKILSEVAEDGELAASVPRANNIGKVTQKPVTEPAAVGPASPQAKYETRINELRNIEDPVEFGRELNRVKNDIVRGYENGTEFTNAGATDHLFNRLEEVAKERGYELVVSSTNKSRFERTIEPVDTAAQEVTTPTAEPELASEMLGSVVENGNPVTTAKPKLKLTGIMGEKGWNAGMRKAKAKAQTREQASTRIKDTSALQTVRKEIRQNVDDINRLQTELNTLEYGSPEYNATFQELQLTRALLADNIHAVGGKVPNNVSASASAPKGNFDNIAATDFRTVPQSNDTMLSVKLSPEEAGVLAERPGIKAVEKDPNNPENFVVTFNKKDYLSDIPVENRPDLVPTLDPFRRVENPVARGDINEKLIENQLETVHALERKRTAQLISGHDATKTEEELAGARDVLRRLENTTQENVNTLAEKLKDYVVHNQKLNKETGQFEAIPDPGLVKEINEQFPTEEARKFIEDAGYRIVTPETGYSSGSRATYATPEGLMTASTPKKAPKNITIVPKDYVSPEGFTIPGNNFNNMVYSPGKGEVTLNVPYDPNGVLGGQANASVLPHLRGINLNGKKLVINNQAGNFYKELKDSGLSRNDFRTNVSNVMHYRGKDLGDGKIGLGIVPVGASIVGSTAIADAALLKGLQTYEDSKWKELQKPVLSEVVDKDGNIITSIPATDYGPARTVSRIGGTGGYTETWTDKDGTAHRLGVNPGGRFTTETVAAPNGRKEEIKTDKQTGKSETNVLAKGTPEETESSFNLGKWNEQYVPAKFNNLGYGHSLFGALAGGALGAGIGGLNYILTDENELSEEEKKKRSLARAMLSSAGIGAGIGGLVGGASDYTRV